MTKLILGIFCTIMAVVSFVGSAGSNDQYQNWIESEGQVVEARETFDSDSPAADNRYWICTVEYTREDGTVWTADDVEIGDQVEYEEWLPIIYDPDSSAMRTGDRPEKNEGILSQVFAWACTAIAVVFYVLAFIEIRRDEKIVAARRQNGAKHPGS